MGFVRFLLFECAEIGTRAKKRKKGGGSFFCSRPNIRAVKKRKMHKSPTEKLATQARSKNESNGQEPSSTSPNKQSSSELFSQQLIAGTYVPVSNKHYQDIPRRNKTKTFRYTLPNTLYSSIDRSYVYFIM